MTLSGAAASWVRQGEEWRDPAQIASQWQEAADTDPTLLASRVRGPFFELLAERQLTVLVTREYEHLLVALGAPGGRPQTSFLRLPHPSGLAVDGAGVVHVASTRNPNQLVELESVQGEPGRPGGPVPVAWPLVPVRTRSLPGALYLHDLAFVRGRLLANAVGRNAVVELPPSGGWRTVWWPRSIEGPDGADFSRNYLQLNSIAAGATLARSFFTASAAAPSARRPGQRTFPVDRRGVLFSGATREPVAGGLTRPHSARLEGDRVLVANSGYGELVAIDGGETTVLARLPGWTRGLWLGAGLAIVGTSRVIPRFRAYAPGLDVDASVCGLHLLELASGRLLASLRWPAGNQIFAVEAVPAAASGGFPFSVGRRGAVVTARTREIFYRLTTRGEAEASHG